MPRHPALTLTLGLVASGAAVVLLLFALSLGFQLAGGSAVASAKGQSIALPALVALLTGIVALGGRRRGWGLVVGCVAAAAATEAMVLAVVIPGGKYRAAPAAPMDLGREGLGCRDIRR